jgi:hypothetical protein
MDNWRSSYLINNGHFQHSQPQLSISPHIEPCSQKLGEVYTHVLHRGGRGVRSPLNGRSRTALLRSLGSSPSNFQYRPKIYFVNNL